jgi:hypothetical protein
MGHLIEVVRAPEQLKRFLVCVPANVYGGLQSLQYTTMIGASQRIGARDWTGKMSADLSKRIFEDMTASISRGEQPEWMQSIRVTQYRSSTEKPVVVVWPREEERAAEEPEVLPVAQATDGAWRLVPTTGFAKQFRGWEYQGAFVDSGNEGRTIRIAGDTKLDCVMRLFGSLSPVNQEFVRTFPFADPNQIPKPQEEEQEYIPTKAEQDSIPAMTDAEWNSIPVETATRRYVLDWKFKVAVDKMSAAWTARQAKQAADKAAADEQEKLRKLREQYRKDDEDKKRKGDL